MSCNRGARSTPPPPRPVTCRCLSSATSVGRTARAAEVGHEDVVEQLGVQLVEFAGAAGGYLLVDAGSDAAGDDRRDCGRELVAQGGFIAALVEIRGE